MRKTHLGTVYLEMREVSRAIDCFTRQLAITRALEDRRSESRALGNLGNAYAQMGATAQAIAYYEQARAIKQEIGDRQEAAMFSWNLGLLLDAQGDRARAVQLMSVYVSYLRDIGHPLADAYAAEVESGPVLDNTASQSALANDPEPLLLSRAKGAAVVPDKDYKPPSKR